MTALELWKPRAVSGVSRSSHDFPRGGGHKQHRALPISFPWGQGKDVSRTSYCHRSWEETTQRKHATTFTLSHNRTALFSVFSRYFTLLKQKSKFLWGFLKGMRTNIACLLFYFIFLYFFIHWNTTLPPLYFIFTKLKCQNIYKCRF